MARFVYYQKDEGGDPEYAGTVTKAKKLIRTQGGKGWIEHVDRDGCLFEVTRIDVAGRNSGFKYNRHL